MPTTTNPRINVTLGKDEFQVIKEYAAAAKTSLSQAILKLALEKLEDYEDMLLAEKAMKRWSKSTSDSWISMEDFEKVCDELPE